MIITITHADVEPVELNPDIFLSAKKDDVEQLRVSILEGQSINSTHSGVLDMTPVHLACIFGSISFLKEASTISDIDPWIRDRNGRLAFDHAAAKNNKVAMRLLYEAMYCSPE